MTTRDIGRTAKSTKARPDTVLIAGEDFDGGCNDFGQLRDAESESRQAIDENYIATMIACGAMNIVRVVMRRIDGRDGRWPVVVHGRRTVRHAREVERRTEKECQVVLEVMPAGTKGAMLWRTARAENHQGLPETDAQRVDYVAQSLAYNMSDDEICDLLQISAARLSAFKALAQTGMIPSVRKHLDDGTMSVTAARVLAGQTIYVQQAVMAKGCKLTVSSIRRAIAGEGTTKATIAPARKAIKRLIGSPESRDRLDEMSLQPSTVIQFMLGTLDMEEYPGLQSLLDEMTQE